MLYDYHIHTKYCRHATGEVQEYVEQALKMGLDEMGFSDHYPMFLYPPSLTPEEYAMTLSEMPRYFSGIKRMQALYRDRITIKTGIEFDYVQGKETVLREEIAKNSFDYVFGSVHLLYDWVIDHPSNAYRYKEVDIDQFYIAYFNALKELVKSRLFDIVAHIDVVKRFGYKPASGYSQLLAEALDLIAENSVVLEINTSGVDAPAGETYPSHEVFKELYKRDIQILLGSDAHAPSQVGRHFEKTLEQLKNAGYTQLVTFEKRKRGFANIE